MEALQPTDQATIQRLCAQSEVTAATVVVSLAWMAGLTRQEIQQLTWASITFDRIQLPHRAIALSPALATVLGNWPNTGGFVLPGRTGTTMPAPSLSRLAHRLLSQVDLDTIRLCDLRHGYICHQLRHRSWASVAQELAMEEGSLRKAYGSAVSPPDPTPQPITPQAIAGLRNSHTLGALAAILAYDQGLSPGELRQLHWADLTVTPQVKALRQDTPLVFPLSPVRLSQLAHSAFIQQGLEGVTLQSLALHHHQHAPLLQVQQHLKNRPSVSGQEVQQLLQRPKSATHRLLQAWVKQGYLVQVGQRYYSADLVPPVDAHAPLVLSLLRRKPAIYATDVEPLLHLPAKECQKLLQTLVTQGQLVRFGGRYQLPPQT